MDKKMRDCSEWLHQNYKEEDLRRLMVILKVLIVKIGPPQGSETANVLGNLEAMLKDAIHRSVDENLSEAVAEAFYA